MSETHAQMAERLEELADYTTPKRQTGVELIAAERTRQVRGAHPMIRSLLHWALRGSTSLGHVSPWNEVIAARHATATERMMLGAAQRRRVVGNRVDEAIVAQREQLVEARRDEEARQRAQQEASQRPAIRMLSRRAS